MEFNTFYHVYNHANGIEDLFKEEQNYYFFIDKIKTYLFPISKIYAYCLMPNHFHLLLKTRDNERVEILPKYDNYEKPALYLSKQFSNCFNSYAQSYNKRYLRRGSLFEKSFKYKAIQDDHYLNHLFAYIHANPINHGFCANYEEWKFSSYLDIVAKDKLLVNAKDVYSLFESPSAFLQFHQDYRSTKDDIKSLNLPK